MSTSMGLICSEHFSAGVCCKREITSTQGTAPGSCSDHGHHGPVTAPGPASLRASLLGVRESMGLGCTGSPPGGLAAPCTAGSLHPAPLCSSLLQIPPGSCLPQAARQRVRAGRGVQGSPAGGRGSWTGCSLRQACGDGAELGQNRGLGAGKLGAPGPHHTWARQRAARQDGDVHSSVPDLGDLWPCPSTLCSQLDVPKVGASSWTQEPPSPSKPQPGSGIPARRSPPEPFPAASHPRGW